MQKTLLYIGAIIVVLIAGFFILNNYIYTEKQGETGFQEGHDEIAYTINGKVVDLNEGEASVDGMTYRVFGEEAEGDITEDGISDLAFILTEELSTSTNYYLVAAVQTDTGYRGTSGALLGENIEPLAVTSRLGGVVVSYYRAEPLATSSATTTTRTERERFFVVVNGELQSAPLPE